MGRRRVPDHCRIRRIAEVVTTVDPSAPATPDETSDERVALRLYIAGQTPKSVRAMENLTILCEKHLAGRYQIEVIDLLEEPRLARADKIVAVPTLIRTVPEPVWRIVGDLSETHKVLVGLRPPVSGSSP